MTQEQTELLIELIYLQAQIVSREALNQTPPKHWHDRVMDVETRLQELAKGDA